VLLSDEPISDGQQGRFPKEADSLPWPGHWAWQLAPRSIVILRTLECSGAARSLYLDQWGSRFSSDSEILRICFFGQQEAVEETHSEIIPSTKRWEAP